MSAHLTAYLTAHPKPAAALAVLLVSLLLAIPAGAQTTIFNTTDFRKDRALWTNPAYYLNNTVGQLRGMALDIESYQDSGQVGSAKPYGSEGTGRAGARNFTSPHPYTSAWEHYQALLEQANGGTQHTKDTIPDWSGRWEGGVNFRGPGPASDLVKLLTPEYQEHFVQELKASAEGRIWSANAFCLPGGYFEALTDSREFIVTPRQVWILGSGNSENYTRWIYTDGSGHAPEEFQYPKWHGESIGFWNGDTLVIHTNQIKGWKGGISEFTDNLETVETYRRNGDKIEGEVTLYDPEVLMKPVTARVSYDLDREDNLALRPMFNTCSDTNGPSSKIYMDERGLLNERTPGDPFYWNSADPRPWGTWFTESDRRYEQYKKTQGQ